MGQGGTPRATYHAISKKNRGPVFVAALEAFDQHGGWLARVSALLLDEKQLAKAELGRQHENIRNRI
jgi:hypothetical protein